MQVRYKCKCMRVEREILVTDRVKGSDIGDWMENVVQSCVGYDHRANNSICMSLKTEYIKIPMAEDGGEIGVPNTKN